MNLLMFINYKPVKGPAVSGSSNQADVAYTRRDAARQATRIMLRKSARNASNLAMR